MDEDDKSKYEKWRNEANRKYAGKWIYNEKWENLYLVDEVFDCTYGFYDGPDAYKYHRFIPPRTRHYMTYRVRVNANIDMRCSSASFGPATVDLLGIMDGSWKIVKSSMVVGNANLLIDRLNERIQNTNMTIDTLKKIADTITAKDKA
jgi:hypothetical protein